MKSFVVLLANKNKKLMNEPLIKGHVEYLQSKWDEGSLTFCGPCTDDTALMVLECDSYEQAKNIVSNDPFSKVSYYRDIDIKEIKPANPENNFHLQEVQSFLDSK
jgi:uncharacterized protein YciI